MSRRRWPVFLACLLACAWASLILAAPFLAAWPGTAARLSAVSYAVGGIVCHQRAERSFHAFGAQLPVCARCTALYLGGAWGLFLGIVLPSLRHREPLALLARTWTWRTVLGLALVPLAASVALEWLGLWTAPNAWRAAASLPAAWAAGALVAESLSFRVTL
jgi:uncharacterized membrane protein